MKLCPSCNFIKPLELFHKRSGRAGGHASHCKDCRSEQERARYAAKAEKIKAKAAESYYNNREARCEKQRAWYAKNKDAVRFYLNNTKEHRNKIRRERLNRDPVAALADRFRRRLNYAIKKQGLVKSNTSNDYLGCSWLELTQHIEKQFLKGMNWNNRHMWEIDHIIPIGTAKTEDDIRRLSHFTNLRPLWTESNRKKAASLSTLF